MKIYLNGVIHTLDPARPRVEAVAGMDGRVVAVGRSAELRPLAGSPGDIIDLGGRSVVPGFVDAHIHFSWLGLSLDHVDLTGAPTLAEAVGRVAARVPTSRPGEWIVGYGWNKNAWRDGRWPTRDDLDAVAPDRPVVLRSKDGHLLWVNGAALKAAGITRDTPDPSGGEITRDARGEPSGVLKEGATAPIYAALPPPTPDEIDAALTRATAHALSLGLTGIGNFEGPEVRASFERLRARSELRLRVVQHIAHSTLGPSALDDALAAGWRSGDGDEWLRTGALKLFADGTLGSQTAALLEPYDGLAGPRAGAGTGTGTDSADGTSHGIQTLSYEQMQAAATRAAAGGIATAIHAIGDRANRDALRALAAAPRVRAMPHRIEHAQLLHPDDVPLFARHGIVASMQPVHLVGDRDPAERYWGARCATAYACRLLHESGAMLTFGSDAPVETCDPLAGLYAAVARHGRGDGRAPWHPEQSLNIMDAVRAYTVGAARASGLEGVKGVLAPGQLADMVVLSTDIFAGSEALEQARVACTIVGGEIAAGGI